MKERDPKAKPPGRNDPCWCGSGKKYKKCHLDADAPPPKGGAVLRRGFEGAGATNKRDHKKTRK